MANRILSKYARMKGGFVTGSQMKRAAGTATSAYKKYKRVAPMLKEARGELNAKGALSVLTKLEKEFRAPRGANGLALGPTKQKKFAMQSLDSTAVGSSTYSNMFYAYRPAVALKSPRQQYRQKTSIRTNLASSEDVQKIGDVSLLDAVPVADNPLSNDKYTNLSIKEAFDKVLRVDMVSDTTQIIQKESNVSIHFENLIAEFLITNGSIASEVTLYDMVPQYDLGPTTYLSESFSNGYMSPSWCWQQGLVSDTLNLNDVISAENLGSVPTDAVTFSRAWKVIKRTTIRMTSNAVHKHIACIGINKSIPYQRYAQASAGGAKFGGFCPTTMVVIRGLPTTDLRATKSMVNISCNLELRYSTNLNQNTQAISFDSTT